MAFAILFVFLHRATGGAKHRPHSLLRPQRWLKQQNDRALMNNKTIHRCATLLLSLLTAVACTSPPSAHRENGWYGIYDGRKDSIALRPVATVKEFVGLRLYRDHLGRSVIAGRVGGNRLQAWADSTSALSGRRMGFVFNDTIIAAPRIYMGLESGQFLISGPDGYDMSRLYKSMLKEKKDSLDALFSANGWLIDTLRFSRLTPGEQDSLANMLDYSDACRLVEGF